MTKNELVREIASRSGLKQDQSGKALDAMIEAIGESLKGGDAVKITGFGTFEARTRAARSGVNPRTGEPLQVPETVVPAFRAGSILKAAVRG